jgi:hypothetical protein
MEGNVGEARFAGRRCKVAKALLNRKTARRCYDATVGATAGTSIDFNAPIAAIGTGCPDSVSSESRTI